MLRAMSMIYGDHVRLLPGLQVVLRHLSSPPDRSYMCQASRCDASCSRTVIVHLATGLDQPQGLTLVRCWNMVLPKPTIRSVDPIAVSELPAIRPG